jgi:hypothetical protein
MQQLFATKKWFLAACVVAISLTACKNRDAGTPATDTVTTTAPADTLPVTAPVVISADDSLRSKTRDALKDYPEVTATVNNGVVTLTGTVTRSKVTRIVQAVQGTRPKKVENQLTIQK